MAKADPFVLQVHYRIRLA